jgi:hypothetical protein
MDEDLGGDDIKLVSYTILFTKRDFEVVLQTERQVIDYATDGGSFAGLKVAKFMEHLRRNGIPWPSAWKERPSGEYQEVGHPIRDIPEGERKYVSVIYRVLSRHAISDAERDNEAAGVLRKIRDTLG